MLLSQTAKQHHGAKHRQLVQHTNNATFTIFIYFIEPLRLVEAGDS